MWNYKRLPYVPELIKLCPDNPSTHRRIAAHRHKYELDVGPLRRGGKGRTVKLGAGGEDPSLQMGRCPAGARTRFFSWCRRLKPRRPGSPSALAAVIPKCALRSMTTKSPSLMPHSDNFFLPSSIILLRQSSVQDKAIT